MSPAERHNIVKLEDSIFIQHPLEQTFAFVADPANLPRWQSGVVEVRADANEPALGARHVEVRSIMGVHVEQTVEIVAYEPNRRLDVKVVDGPLSLQVGHSFGARDGGTTIDVVGEGDVGALFRMAEFLVARALKRQARQDFERLKELLETAEE